MKRFEPNELPDPGCITHGLANRSAKGHSSAGGRDHHEQDDVNIDPGAYYHHWILWRSKEPSTFSACGVFSGAADGPSRLGASN